ncbi:MAG: hypothetical protein PHY12_13005, partial [Eubacteriales bacterium]|nr:hypothetical protein [Eubacteriales bacterium]
AVGSLSESDAITDAPALLNGSLLFPTDAVHVWNLTQGELVATLSQGGAGTDEWMDSAPYGDEASAADGAAALSGFAPRTRLTLSDDGKWVTVAGEHGTALYRTRDWKYLGNLSNRPVEVLRLSREQIVYDTGEALYQIKRETGEEES